MLSFIGLQGQSHIHSSVRLPTNYSGYLPLMLTPHPLSRLSKQYIGSCLWHNLMLVGEMMSWRAGPRIFPRLKPRPPDASSFLPWYIRTDIIERC